MSTEAAHTATRVVSYVGRKTDFCGKTLWEIIGSLRNQGVGRLIERGMFTRYPEPCYMRIVRVETCPDEPPPEEGSCGRRVRVWVQKTFRGNTFPHPTEMYRTTYKTDYRLIPKNEEAKYLNNKLLYKKPEALLPTSVEMPPLMKEFIIVDCERKGAQAPTEFVMPLSYNRSPNRLQSIAKQGDKSVPPFRVGLGIPVSPTMYEGLQLQ